MNQAKALLDLYVRQHAECYSDPRAPGRPLEDCRGDTIFDDEGLVFDDEEQIEYDRLRENMNDAIRRYAECLNEHTPPTPK